MKRWLVALLLSVPALAFADGMIVIARPAPAAREPFPLAVKYHHVDVKVHDGVARTSIDQEFFNPTGSRLEGVYIFPLPQSAVISDFAMEIDGKETHAELLDAAKARSIYEEIVRTMRDPALLEYSGSGAFKVRIFPIEPHAGKRVKLSYSEVLKSDGGMFAYTYPLNTEKFSAEPLDDVAIRIDVDTTRPLRTVFCPTHDVDVHRRNDHHATVGFEARHTTPNRDLTLYYSTDDRGVALSALTHHPAGEDGYFLLTVTPSYDDAEPPQPKDVTFVLDVSGSMAGEKMSQARRAIRFCLANLNRADRFEVIRFSTEADALFGGLERATAENVARAQEYVAKLEAIGGTNAEEALELAMKANETLSDRPKVVIFITDGKPTIGETNDERLVRKVRDANTSHMRIFTFGVGDDLNTHFLDKLTEATRAARTYVGEKQDLEVPISSFFEKIKSPVLVNPSLTFGPGVKAFQMYPRDLPDLFKGAQLTVFGRYSGSGDAVTLTGTVNGKRVTMPYTARFASRNDGNDVIAPLWAAQRIGYLLDQIRLHGQEKELVDEVTRLARRYGVITPYTSYLIVEDERRLPRSEQTLNEDAGARMKKEYDAMGQTSGAPSVQASKDVEALKNARNQAQVAQGAARMNYRDDAGRTQNLAAQTKNVAGRAVYQQGDKWIDSRAQSMSQQNVRRIRFASEEYFALLHTRAAAAPFLALGRNVRFALGDEVVEVFE
jgi:Ca-activated chloride channel family protein